MKKYYDIKYSEAAALLKIRNLAKNILVALAFP